MTKASGRKTQEYLIHRDNMCIYRKRHGHTHRHRQTDIASSQFECFVYTSPTPTRSFIEISGLQRQMSPYPIITDAVKTNDPCFPPPSLLCQWTTTENDVIGSCAPDRFRTPLDDNMVTSGVKTHIAHWRLWVRWDATILLFRASSRLQFMLSPVSLSVCAFPFLFLSVYVSLSASVSRLVGPGSRSLAVPMDPAFPPLMPDPSNFPEAL